MISSDDYPKVMTAMPQKPFEPLVWLTFFRLFPMMPEDKRNQARREYKKLRKHLSVESTRRALAFQIIILISEA